VVLAVMVAPTVTMHPAHLMVRAAVAAVVVPLQETVVAAAMDTFSFSG
jgi:hypothetical protein